MAVDGEPGFSLNIGRSRLTLRKADRRVRMPYDGITLDGWGRRYRYSPTIRTIGIALLPVLGAGAVLLALYYLSGYDALFLKFGGREYPLSGDRALLERLRRRIRGRRAGPPDDGRPPPGAGGPRSDESE
ncbi:MAG: hypothetical protein FJ149_01565 [Euryarchaeota archaeon]|nr:hypothetical protein [Euryarchaeota archaeon]